MNCKICGQSDLFTEVADSKTCSVCTINFIGGGRATDEYIAKVRTLLDLKDGEYLKQDNAKEAARILGHR